MYPDTVTQQSSAQSVLPRIRTDPIGRQMRPPSSLPTGRRSPNTQWSALGGKSPRAVGVRKKKGVDPAIAALQTQLNRTTGEIGEQLGAASESVEQVQTTAQATLHHAQAAKAESAQMRSMIDETLRAFCANVRRHAVEVGRRCCHVGTTTGPRDRDDAKDFGGETYRRS